MTDVDAAPLPRLMTKAEAAAYCRVSLDGFGKWVRMRIVPGPIPGTRRWDRIALDRALDRASGLIESAVEESSLEKFRRERAGRKKDRGGAITYGIVDGNVAVTAEDPLAKWKDRLAMARKAKKAR